LTLSAVDVTALPAALTSLPAPAVVLQALKSIETPNTRAKAKTERTVPRFAEWWRDIIHSLIVAK